MRRLLFLILLSAGAISLYAFSREKRIQWKGEVNVATVSAVIHVDQATLIKVVTKAFRENRQPPPNKFSRFSLVQPGEEDFPSEYQLTHYKSEESILRYLSIPPERRKLDFYLYDFSEADNHGSYWASEYYQGEKPVPFRCNFLIHHEPEGAASTRIEIFEFAPRVWAGKKITFDRHGPGYIVDIKNVAPTTSDRVEVLDLIKASVPQ